MTAPFVTHARALLREMRPQQWVKNVFVVAPLLFAGPALREQGAWTVALVLRVALGFTVFCLASSATYILNDLHDVQADRLHPVKRNRPIASGELPERLAWAWFGAFLALASVAALQVGGWFAGCVGAYFVMNLAYSKGLKRVAWVDTLVIALGFLLRILAGGEAAAVHLSRWLVTCTVLLALFLALGKRKHELLTSDAAHRAALTGYQASHLQVALWALAAGTVAAYAGYTLDPDTTARFHTSLLPWTVPFPLLGLWRFARLLDRPDTSHSPTERMLRDPLFVLNLLAWAGTTLAMIYGLFGAPR
jgi:decaprenyl-phosphate phosphoribosyltransferase